jgi:hypothetical protein
MSDFFKDASKLSWWVGVLLVGLVLNVVASYIRSWMDRTGRFVTERRRRRSARYREEVIRQADSIRGQPFSVHAHLNRSIRVRLHGVSVLVMGCIVAVIGMNSASQWVHLFALVTAVGCILFAMAFDRRGDQMETVALEAGMPRNEPAGDKNATPSQEKGQPAT